MSELGELGEVTSTPNSEISFFLADPAGSVQPHCSCKLFWLAINVLELNNASDMDRQLRFLVLTHKLKFLDISQPTVVI